MDPLGASTVIVDALSLPRWSSTPVPCYAAPLPDTKRIGSPFPVRQDLNSKVALWLVAANVTELNCTSMRFSFHTERLTLKGAHST